MCDAINLMGDLSASRKDCNTMINRMSGEGGREVWPKRVAAVGLVIFLSALWPTLGMGAEGSLPDSGSENQTDSKPSGAVSVARFTGTDAQVSIPLVTGGNVLFTDAVRINGKRLGYFLVDTGSNITLVSPDIAKALGLASDAMMNVEGKAVGSLCRVNALLSVGPLTIQEHPIGVMSLDPLQKFGKPVVGVLGADVLGKIPFTVDYRQEVLTLHDPRRFKPPSGAKAFGLTITKLQSEPGLANDGEMVGTPAVTASLNGRETCMVLDTGLSQGVFVAASDASRHPGKIGRPVHPLREVTVLAHQEDPMRTFVIDELVLFGRRWRDVPFGITDAAATEHAGGGQEPRMSAVGGMLLRENRLTFNMPERKLWVSPTEMPVLSNDALNEENFAGVPRIIEAVYYGDVELFKHLLKHGASLQFKDDAGYNIVHSAVIGESVECLRLLLAQESCPKLSESTPDGVTPLMLAAGLCELELAREFIEAGADVNSQTIKGDTALRYAVDSDCIDGARMLLEAGARPDLALFDGNPPLALAAAKGNYEMVRLLVKHGAALVFATKRRQTLVHCAAFGGSTEILELALNGLPEGAANQATKDGTTPLMVAAEQGHLQVVEELVKAGADVRAGSSVNQSVGEQMAIHFAATKGRDDVVRFLLEQGVSVDQGTSKGLTPLMLAAGGGHASTVGLLLNNGAGVNRTETYEMTALHYAAKLGRPGVIPALLNAGARVASPAQKGVRPLDFAAFRGDVDIARLLVEAGADPAAKGTHGNSAIDFARKQGHSSLVEFLEKKAAAAPPAASGASPSPMAVEPPKAGGLSLNIRTPGGFKLIARGNILFCTDKDDKAVWQTAIPEGTTGFTIQNDKVMLKPHGPVIDLQSATLVPGPTPLPK